MEGVCSWFRTESAGSRRRPRVEFCRPANPRPSQLCGERSAFDRANRAIKRLTLATQPAASSIRTCSLRHPGVPHGPHRVESVHPRHVDVAHDGVEWTVSRECEFRAGAGANDVRPVLLEGLREHGQQFRIVLGDQNAWPVHRSHLNYVRSATQNPLPTPEAQPHAEGSLSARRKVKKNVAPSPGLLWTQMRPP
jgi:hypothetical protein